MILRWRQMRYKCVWFYTNSPRAATYESRWDIGRRVRLDTGVYEKRLRDVWTTRTGPRTSWSSIRCLIFQRCSCKAAYMQMELWDLCEMVPRDTIPVWRAAGASMRVRSRPAPGLRPLPPRRVASVQAPGPVKLRVRQDWGWGGGGGWRLGGTKLLPTHAGSVHLLLLYQFGRVDEVPAVEEDHAAGHNTRRAPEQHVRQSLRPGVAWVIQWEWVTVSTGTNVN